VFPRDGPATAAIVWFLFLEDQTTAVLQELFVKEQDEGKGQAHRLWTVTQPMARAMSAAATRWVCNVWRRNQRAPGVVHSPVKTTWRQKIVARQNGSSAPSNQRGERCEESKEYTTHLALHDRDLQTMAARPFEGPPNRPGRRPRRSSTSSMMYAEAVATTIES
jgi:hypothetical protein